MERSLPQLAGAWRPLGDGLGLPLPLGLPSSGEPGPPLGKDDPGGCLRSFYVTRYRPQGFRGK